jgi:hypothetical protein
MKRKSRAADGLFADAGSPEKYLSYRTVCRVSITIPDTQLRAIAPPPSLLRIQATLEERLAHLNNALFDYNKYVIRPYASSALKDDLTVIRIILATCRS